MSGYDGEKPLLTADTSEAFKMKGTEACEGNFPLGRPIATSANERLQCMQTRHYLSKQNYCNFM